MTAGELKSIDDYEAFLGRTLERWSPGQRVALAAAMAERWLPVYEAFAAAEEWGDPAALRDSLEAAWGHLCGRRLTAANLARHADRLHDVTPHMDDFDAPEALAACVIVASALKCCESPDNVWFAVEAAHSGFEAVVPHWEFDPEEQPRLWKQVAARKELRKQLKLVDRVGSVTHFDDRAIADLRRGLTDRDLVGEVSPPPKTAAPVGRTNQAAFEQYRRLLEHQLRRPPWVPPAGDAYLAAIMVFSEWGSRYCQRLCAITGKEGGQLADIQALRSLVARLRAKDAPSSAVPGWDAETRQVIGLCLGNPLGEYDVKGLDEPHGYGPSLRRLWADAKRSGRSDGEAWAYIVAWSRHKPAAWAAEDARKKKGHAYTVPALSGHLARTVTWEATDDVDHPWAADVDNAGWRVRLNDFPDDLMYTLVIGVEAVGAFHDWPETWTRG